MEISVRILFIITEKNFNNEILYKMLYKIKKKISPFLTILLGFAGIILLGSFLLSLPFASANGEWTPYINALFTSTSATCVTGLVTYDTATHWSVFGQVVIILLIQTGGMGVISIAAAFAILSGKKIGLFGRNIMKEAIAAPNVGGIVRLTGFALKGILLIELIGAIALLFPFCRDYGAKGVWLALFHSVSAFCNAGFDLFGNKTGQFSSLTSYESDPVVNIVIMLLIIIGGIGFLTWEDVVTHKWRFKKYRTQSKLIIIASAALILLPAVYFFFFEYQDCSFGERILLSLFQSVSPRTAGFNTSDLTKFTDSGIALMIVLMLIGGASGSTAGGMKVSTFAILLASANSVFHRKKHVTVLKRRITDDIVKNAAAIAVMYVTLFLFVGMSISIVEGISLKDCLFETASAIATVGLTLGITPSLSIISKILLIALMYAGRVGGLTLIYAALKNRNADEGMLPAEQIAVG